MVRGFSLLAWLAAGSAASAAVVLDPVPAPILPGLTAGLRYVGRAPQTGTDSFKTRLQSLQALPDGSGRQVVHDTRGLISLMPGGGGTPTPWLDLRAVLPGFSNATNAAQTGLMSIAFHPNFAGNPKAPGYGTFYTIDTSAPSGGATLVGNGPSIDHDDIVHEFRVADPAAPTATIVGQREVLRVGQPLTDHGPGTIAFNPTADPSSPDYGKLYIGLGDGGGVGDPYANAQDLQSPFGKILRIDPAVGEQGEPYTIPADNPFAGQPGKLGEVWASGLRNPQHFSWDADGRMLIADMGQAQIDEVDVGVKGRNYGWPAREGTLARGNDAADPYVYDLPLNDGSFADPLAQFDHQELFDTSGFPLTAIGGVFGYHGAALPGLDGMVVLSELVSGRLFYFDPAGVAPGTTAALRELMLTLDGLDVTMAALAGNPGQGGRVDLRLGTGGDGELYLLSKANGDIWALAAVPEPAAWAELLLGFGLIGARLRRRKPIRAGLRRCAG